MLVEEGGAPEKKKTRNRTVVEAASHNPTSSFRNTAFFSFSLSKAIGIIWIAKGMAKTKNKAVSGKATDLRNHHGEICPHTGGHLCEHFRRRATYIYIDILFQHLQPCCSSLRRGLQQMLAVSRRRTLTSVDITTCSSGDIATLGALSIMDSRLSTASFRSCHFFEAIWMNFPYTFAESRMQ